LACRRGWGCGVGLLAISLLVGCAAPPARPSADRLPPLLLTTHDQAGVRDLRGAFRSALCAQLGAAPTRPCDDVLTRVFGETDGDAAAPPTKANARPMASFRIAIVPGFFAECLPPEVRPFADAIKILRDQGFEVVDLQVGGRGSVAANAARLAREVAALPDDARPLIVFGYSKGLPDALELVAQYPEARRHIAAIVGVAGAANGSPLVEHFEGLYRATLERLPFDSCAAGDGEELHDLRRDVRMTWWQTHRQRIGVPLYSIVALPQPAQVSPILSSSHTALARIDPYNDGQLLWSDAVTAPGALLGYVNADHWAIAMRLSHALPLLGPLFRDDVPRAALLRAAIEVVALDLETVLRRSEGDFSAFLCPLLGISMVRTIHGSR
jgi:hypothetical protein